MEYNKADILSYFYKYTSRNIGPGYMIKNQEEYDLYRNYIDIIRNKIRKCNTVKRVSYYTIIAIAVLLFFVAPVILHSYYELPYMGAASMAIGGIMLYAFISKPLKAYTIYNLIGDVKFDSGYATVLSEACVLIKHWHDVGQNRLTPVSLEKKEGFPKYYMEKLGFENLYKRELVAYVLLADAMLVDSCLACAHKEWYSLSSDTKLLDTPIKTVIEMYNKEV